MKRGAWKEIGILEEEKKKAKKMWLILSQRFSKKKNKLHFQNDHAPVRVSAPATTQGLQATAKASSCCDHRGRRGKGGWRRSESRRADAASGDGGDDDDDDDDDES